MGNVEIKGFRVGPLGPLHIETADKSVATPDVLGIGKKINLT